MRNRLISIGTVACALCLLIIVGFSVSLQQYQSHNLSVAFLDVGQGDSIFIETPDHHQILIDGGVDNTVLARLGTLMRPGDTTIDLVIATHPDADHIGGLVDVLRHYNVATFMSPDYESETAIYKELIQTVHDRVPNYEFGFIGDRVDAGDGVTLDLLAPYNLETKESNEVSIVTKLTYGNFSVMLTGDAPIIIEQQLVRWYGNQLDSDILKAGHHGSKTSTSSSWVAAVDPDVGIISAGKNNRYGHPHQQVIDILEKAHVQILRTSDEGTIIFESDGTNVWGK